MRGCTQVRALAPTVLHGRKPELRRLLAVLERVDKGGCERTVLLSGAPGIGKSAMLDAFAGHATDRGAHVLRGRAERFERGLPYSTFIDALAGLAATSGQPLSEPARLALDSTTAASDDPTASFAGVFRSCWHLLEAAASERPLVVALDDFHDADDDTVGLTAALVRRSRDLPVLFLLAMRDPTDEPSPALEAFLNRSTQSASSEAILLGPLSRTEVADLVAARTGHQPSERLLDHVCSRAGGNPFLLGEVLRALVEAGTVYAVGDHVDFDPDTAQPSISLTVLGRFLPLSTVARRLARVLATRGEATLAHLDVLADAAGIETRDAVTAFDQLVRAGVIEALDDNRFRFAHDLVREALLRDVGPAAGRRIHRTLAEGLLAHRGAAGFELTEVAHHAVMSAESTDEFAAALATEVGDQMFSTGPATAARWFGTAVALTAGDPRLFAHRRARHAQALVRCGRLQEGLRVGRQALDDLDPGLDRDRTSEALVLALLAHGEATEALAVIDADPSSPGGPRRAVWRGSALALLGDWRAAADQAACGRRLARPGSADAFLALVDELQVAHGRGDRCREIALLDELDRAAMSASEAAQLFAWRFAAYVAAGSKIVDKARLYCDKAAQVAKDRPELGGAAMVESAASLLAWAAGEWDVALDRIQNIAPELEATGQWVQVTHLVTAEVHIRLARGDLAGARKVVLPSHPMPPPYASALAEAAASVHVQQGEGRKALALLDSAADGLTHGIASITNRARSAVIAADIGQDPRSRLDEAREAAGLCATPYGDLVVELAEAMAAGSAASAGRAVALADEQCLPFEAGQARLLRGSTSASEEDLTAAWRSFSRLGAEPWRRAAAVALRERNLPVPRARRRDPQSLTDTELQVAQLVRAGLRNREIAEELCYSARTVEAYLTRIYRKVGVDSRLALARALDSADLGSGSEEDSA